MPLVRLISLGDAWDLVAKARRGLPAYDVERVMFEGGFVAYTEYFSHARTLLRGAEESRKPNGQRLPEYTDARKPLIERRIGSVAPIYPALERARLAASLAIARDKLGANHPLVKQILGPGRRTRGPRSSSPARSSVIPASARRCWRVASRP